jgi:hypothetical protein
MRRKAAAMIQPSAGGSALGAAPAAESHRVLRVLALLAVSAGVVVLAAAAFVLSYTGVHEVALAAGVSKTLARIYPPMFDAILVIAAAAVLSLRGAGWIVRTFAWLCLVVVLAATAWVDTLYAIGTHLPHRTAAITAAVVPWALVLIGFVLLLAMLRHARLRRARSRRAALEAADTIPGSVPDVAGAMLPAATSFATGAVAGRAEDDWPGGGSPNGRDDDVRSHGQTTTGYPGDVLVAGRPPTEEPATEAAPDAVAAGEAVEHDPAATVPAQALPARAEGADTVPAATRPGLSGGTAEAGLAGDAGPGETTAGIPLRWPGGDGGDQAETAESSLDSEPDQDDPVSDEAHPASRPGVIWVPRAREEPSDEVIRDDPGPYPSPVADPATGQGASAAPETAGEANGTAPASPGPSEPGLASPAAAEPDESRFAPGPGSAEPGASTPAAEQPGDEPTAADQLAEPAATDPAADAPTTQQPGDEPGPTNERARPAATEPTAATPAPQQPGDEPGTAGQSATSAPEQPGDTPGPAGQMTDPGGVAPGADASAAEQSGGEPGSAPGPAGQAAKPAATSFWDSVFGPRKPAGSAAADEARDQPSGASEESAGGHPATQANQAGEGAEPDEEPQFDRFRSSPTPPDDE